MYHSQTKKAINKKTLKLYILALLADWLTLNLSLLVLHLLGWFPVDYDCTREFVTEWVAANVAYFCAVSLMKLSLHKRMTAPYQVIKNTTYTAIVYAIFLAAFLGTSVWHHAIGVTVKYI